MGIVIVQQFTLFTNNPRICSGLDNLIDFKTDFK